MHLDLAFSGPILTKKDNFVYSNISFVLQSEAYEFTEENLARFPEHNTTSDYEMIILVTQYMIDNLVF